MTAVPASPDEPGPGSVAAAFRDGIRRGEDPVNTVTSGSALTTNNSKWFRSYCKTCRHNFRLDDPVVVAVDEAGVIREVRHDGQPWCGEPAREVPLDEEIAAAFFGAIDEFDPPDTPYMVRLLPGHPMLQVRQAVRAKDCRFRCMVCSNTFRPFEFVVVCVCSPQQRVCALTVHRDSAHNLLCYDDLLSVHAGRKISVCPMNYRTVP